MWNVFEDEKRQFANMMNSGLGAEVDERWGHTGSDTQAHKGRRRITEPI